MKACTTYPGINIQTDLGDYTISASFERRGQMIDKDDVKYDWLTFWRHCNL